MMRKFVLAVALALLPAAGTSCEMLQTFEMAQLAGADLVIVGDVTAYQDLGTAWGAALVTVQVTEILKGRAKDTVILVWNGGMAQGPHESRAKGRVLVGAMNGGRIAVSDMVPDLRRDLPSIVQPLCGEVWMQPATKAAVAMARTVLE